MVSPEWVQAIASIATFGAAGVAVWATFKAPERAAKFAEDLRVANMAEEEARRMKLFVFTNLMQYRAKLMDPTCIGSLNLIDVVYRDSAEVRLAWKHFTDATAEDPSSFAKILERYHSIIEKMARNLGLSDQITIADIQNSYYPRALGEVDEAFALENRAKIKQYRDSLGDN